MDFRKLQTDGNLKIPSAPLMFFLDLTEHCNLNCYFCYNGSTKGRIHAKVEDVKQILDVMHKVDCNEVVYLGGEPTIYPNLFEVLNYAESLDMKQSLISNAQVIDSNFAKRLAKIKALEVGVSIHSHNDSTHNAFTTNVRSFKNVKRAITSLEENNVRWYSQTSLMKSNYLGLKRLHSYLIECGSPTRMDLSRMVVGKNSSAEFLGDEEYTKVFEQINSIDTQRLPIRIEAFPRCWLLKISKSYSLNYNKIKKAVRPCYAWVGQVSIDVSGNLRLCPTGGELAGNVLTEGIENIWNNSIIRRFQNFKWQKTECLMCKDFAFCVGGCKMTCSGISPSPDIYIVEGGFKNACYPD